MSGSLEPRAVMQCVIPRLGTGLLLALSAIAAFAQTPLPRPISQAPSDWRKPLSACASLAKTTLPGVTIIMAQDVPAGSFQAPPIQGPGGGPAVAHNFSVPSFCRVAATLKPTPQSNIQAEIWLPSAGWNGNFVGVGNAGFAGSILYDDLGSALRAGYAAVSSDSGHTGGSPIALGQAGLEALTDFGWRATHEMTVLGKALVTTFYGVGPSLSYFTGCSGGGRMGLIEAQRFPEDYDGIVAGSSAFSYARLTAFDTWKGRTNIVDDKPVLGPDQFALLRKSALKACDAKDGIVDGEISDPRACDFKPSSLVCKAGQDSADCLTPEQITIAEKLYGGMRNTKSGALLAAGMIAGGEESFVAATQKLNPIGGIFYSRLVFRDPSYDALKIDYSGDVEHADSVVEAIIAKPDLTKVAARGGKLIQYASWNEATPTPEDAINYYEAVIKAVGGLKQAQAVDRLFIVPNANHCGGGYAAPWFTTMTDWVEHKQAPDRILADRLAFAPPGTPGVPPAPPVVIGQRPLCAYPTVQHYKGSGDPNTASSFVCKVAARGPRPDQKGVPAGVQ
jgi:feruloyl esterase